MTDKLVGYINPLFPLRDELFGRVHSEFDQFFNEFFKPDRAKRTSNRTYPKVDIFELDGHLFIKAAVPGMCRSDLEITLENRQLTISGQHKTDSQKLVADSKYHFQELKKSKFARSFTLPHNYPEPEAKLENGVLTLKFKDVVKDNKPKRKQIDIK